MGLILLLHGEFVKVDNHTDWKQYDLFTLVKNYVATFIPFSLAFYPPESH